MSLGHGASIVRDGLVFCYDQGNIQKSWKGAPATNLFTQTNLNNWSINGAAISTSQYVTPFDDAAYAITDSNTGAYSNIDRNTTVANDSASYTVSLMVRKTYGATSATLGFNIGFNGGTQVALSPRFNSDTGVGYGSSIDFGDWWYWYFTITNNSSGNTNLYCQFFPATGVHNGSDNVIGVGTAIIGSMMLVAGSVAARFVNGTRSTTQAVLDLTGRNTLTANSLTYASNNTFSFDGVDDLINAGNNAILNVGNNITVNAWVFIGSTASYQPIVSKVVSDYTLGWELANSSGALRATVRPAPIDIASGALTINSWNMTTMTFNGTTLSLYLNGVFQTSSTGGSVTLNSTQDMYIGSRIQGNFFNGNVSNVQIYNRALTVAEIKQNFEAIRGRYGI
jgi:hypothetical protein